MRFLSTLVVLGSLVAGNLAAVSCPSPATCKGLTATVASALKGYAPATSLCTSKFPVPRRTCTSTAPGVVTTLTVATATTTTTIATETAIFTGPPTTTTTTSTITPTVTATSTDTQIATVSTTTTVTITAQAKKKRSQPTAGAVDPRASQLRSLVSQASSFVGAVCTCLETAISTTLTTTPTSTNTVTATVTLSVIATTTSTLTPTITATTTATAAAITITATITVSSTTTTTGTSTTTVAPSRATCSAPESAPFSSDCNGVTCSPDARTCYVYPEGYQACFSSPECSANDCAYYNDGSSRCISYENGCCPNDRRLRHRRTAPVSGSIFTVTKDDGVEVIVLNRTGKDIVPV